MSRMQELLDYIHYLANTHTVLRTILISSGKTYRSQKVAFENGYITALRDLEDCISEPRKRQELERAMHRLVVMSKEQR